MDEIVNAINYIDYVISLLKEDQVVGVMIDKDIIRHLENIKEILVRAVDDAV